MCKNNKYDVSFENTFMITSNIEKSHKYDFDIFNFLLYLLFPIERVLPCHILYDINRSV